MCAINTCKFMKEICVIMEILCWSSCDAWFHSHYPRNCGAWTQQGSSYGLFTAINSCKFMKDICVTMAIAGVMRADPIWTCMSREILAYCRVVLFSFLTILNCWALKWTCQKLSLEPVLAVEDKNMDQDNNMYQDIWSIEVRSCMFRLNTLPHFISLALTAVWCMYRLAWSLSPVHKSRAIILTL